MAVTTTKVAKKFKKKQNKTTTTTTTTATTKMKLIKTLLVVTNFKIHKISKGKKVNKFIINIQINHSINTKSNWKTRFVQHKTKNAIISWMFLTNVLRKTGSDFCPTGIFPRTFTYFGFMLFDIHERISMYVDPRP